MNIGENIDRIEINRVMGQPMAKLFDGDQQVHVVNGAVAGYVSNYVRTMGTWKRHSQEVGVWVKVKS